MPIQFKRNPDGTPSTNVQHRVTRGAEKDIDHKSFEWGFHGAGPNELAMNILYNAGLAEADALRLSSYFSQDILAGIPHEGAMIQEQVVDDWIALNRERTN